ncbi:MAG: hypothetical protein O7B99_10605 [Planctomycetota bacterium]|nr:hypothetical protein [Planctomycetota bacterium]
MDSNHQSDFYNDKKWCAHCEGYTTYLQSLEHSYCAQCGNKVRLFSEEDWSSFHESLKERRPKGGRPRKNRGKESA